MRSLSVLTVLALAGAAWAADPDKEGFVPMFNGKDLSGWVNVNTHPKTFFVKEDMIITTGRPTGYMRTDKQYENFIAEFDWMHIPNKPGAVGNSGFFVWADPIPAVGTGYTRGIEVQVLVNLTYKNDKGQITATSQGDLFSIWGATCVPDRPHPNGSQRCLPKEDHCKGEKEWNHYRVVAKDGRIELSVNGHEVSGVSKCSPRKGYLALESEGSECRFKNLMIKELSSTNPKPEEVAKVSEGHVSLFNGIDLDGWTHYTPPGIEEKKGWKAGGEKLIAGGTTYLSTEKEFGACELVFDWKLPAKAAEASCVVEVCGKMYDVKLSEKTKPGGWHREMIKVANGGKAPIRFLPKEGLELMNVFIRELK
ncbi:MAG TPA: family 16 glycoside hydrolase [Gemmataceae bacterium]|jgi:hypothetical protein|nr:family 16 glycoside hydrolase [Gemmataceae bacterium]